jgi:hypothetical protein
MLVRAAAEDKCVLIHPLLGKECRCPVSQLVAFNDELLRPTGELLYNQSDTTMAIAMQHWKALANGICILCRERFRLRHAMVVRQPNFMVVSLRLTLFYFIPGYCKT